jgi:hypothetical protein
LPREPLEWGLIAERKRRREGFPGNRARASISRTGLTKGSVARERAPGACTEVRTRT